MNTSRGHSRSQSHSSRSSNGGFRNQRSSFGSRGFRPPQRRSSRSFKGADIHHSKFISRAEPIEAAAPYVPKHTFADFAIDERIKQNISRKGYVTPTPIQDQSIPRILEGRDIVGIANTGTGKTGAFLIPLFDKVVRSRHERVLIMVPTRELAIQIDDEYRGFAAGSGIRSVCVVGGVNISPQIRALRDDPAFVIGTPGRLKDVMERGELDLSQFKTLVLDEADRMLDMGFINDMRHILSFMPKERHTLFFSATLSSDIEKLIHEFLNDPVRVSVKVSDSSKNVDQDVIRIAHGRTKYEHLHELLSLPEFSKVMVFCRTKHGAEKLVRDLTRAGFRAESIHGNKSHSQRQRALQSFKDERAKVLVATDVAARGLDIPKVTHVINYDVPNSYEEYVHRIGRTGRAGEIGKALTFIEH